MEKLIYSLWDADPGILLGGFVDSLRKRGVQNLRINVRDDAVEAGSGLIQHRGEALPDAVVQFWLPSSNVIFRKDVDAVIEQHCASFQAWLAAESAIIANQKHPSKIGERTEGFAQIAFLMLPKDMDWKEWRTVWRDYHTQIAIDTQSNFEYVQNLVIEPLSEDASPFVAIVEECFPIAALTDPLVFFDAKDDQEKFEKNLAAMMESCQRFIEPGTIDVFPTSQFNYGN